jgi:hypothetical protein
MSSLDDIAAEALAAPRSPFSRNDAPTPDPTHSMVESFRCDMLNAARKASSTVHQDADRYNVELEPLVRRACQVDAFREVLLEMRGRDAQCVVDAIEQVRHPRTLDISMLMNRSHISFIAASVPQTCFGDAYSIS